MSHTPGPWNWLNYPDGRRLLTGVNRAVIHCPGPGPQIGITDEDELLIAAAPDLLEACEEALVQFWGADAGKLDALVMLRKAVRKAKGTTP